VNKEAYIRKSHSFTKESLEDLGILSRYMGDIGESAVLRYLIINEIRKVPAFKPNRELDKVDRWVAYKNHVKQLGIDEITKYCISSAKLILRIFEAYLVKKSCSEASSFKDKFALVVANMELIEENKASSIRRSIHELIPYAQAFYDDLFIHLIVSTIFELRGAIAPPMQYIMNEEYLSYLQRFGTLCRKWNKLKKDL
jgi:hypothetical protein